jgi:hypothetical protein
MLSCIKFFQNSDERKRNEIPVISRTLCKITMISKEYKGEMPKDGEWWWVQIVQETFAKNSGSSTLSGVFVVEPIRPIERRVLRLIPGMFTHRLEENVLIIRPSQNLELPWIMPKQLRDQLRKKYKALSVIVDSSPSDYSEVLNQVDSTKPKIAETSIPNLDSLESDEC